MSYIVPLELPESCSDCPFATTSFYCPLWSKDEKRGMKGYNCNADKAHRPIEMDIDDTTTKADWCPLKEVKNEKV